MNWRDLASCANEDPRLFFPARSNPGHEARRICAACLVKAQCLQFALQNNEQNGIWGGTSINQRRRMEHRAADTGPQLCPTRRHVMDDANTRIVTVTGKQYTQCRACRREREAEKRAAERVRLTGSSSPHSGKRLEKRKNFATITAELQSIGVENGE